MNLRLPTLQLLGIITLLLTSTVAGAQTRTYCCVDNNGRKICGDTLPQICYDRAYLELSSTGRVLREVEAQLSPEQRAKRDAELKAQREKAIREAEAKRRDRVLLDSYASVAEIEARRDREVAQIETDVKRARAQETELLAVRAKLEKLKPASGPVPKDVVEDLLTNASELAAARSVIDSKLRDIELTRARFDADRDRFLLLTSQSSSSSRH